MTRIYKLLTRAEWLAASDAGVFTGSPVDVADGFIHFSTAAQAVETGRKYFAGVAELVAVAFEAETLGAGLTWEPSPTRGSRRAAATCFRTCTARCRRPWRSRRRRWTWMNRAYRS